MPRGLEVVGEEGSPVEGRRGGRGRSPRGRLLPLLAILGLLLLLAGTVRAVITFATTPPGRPSTMAGDSQQGANRDALVEEGKKVYQRECASCHGAQGNRIPVSPLSSRRYVNDLGNRLDQAVIQGIGTMPAWGKERGGPLDSRQVKAVREYIQASLAVVADDSPSATSRPSSGSPTAPPTPLGYRAPPAIPHALKDQASRCLECHDRGRQLPMPVNHAGRTNNSCSLCHAQPQTPEEAAPTPGPGSTPQGTRTPQR